jgi:hypothetical protein
VRRSVPGGVGRFLLACTLARSFVYFACLLRIARAHLYVLCCRYEGATTLANPTYTYALPRCMMGRQPTVQPPARRNTKH